MTSSPGAESSKPHSQGRNVYAQVTQQSPSSERPIDEPDINAGETDLEAGRSIVKDDINSL